MTIEQILGDAKNLSPNELKDRLYEKSMRSEIQSRISRLGDYMGQIERVIYKIVDGSIATTYLYSRADGGNDQEKMPLSEEDKVFLIEKLKEICFRQLECYKRDLDSIFNCNCSKETKVEAKVEVKAEPALETPVVSRPNYFGY